MDKTPEPLLFNLGWLTRALRGKETGKNKHTTRPNLDESRINSLSAAVPLDTKCTAQGQLSGAVEGQKGNVNVTQLEAVTGSGCQTEFGFQKCEVPVKTWNSRAVGCVVIQICAR